MISSDEIVCLLMPQLTSRRESKWLYIYSILKCMSYHSRHFTLLVNVFMSFSSTHDLWDTEMICKSYRPVGTEFRASPHRFNVSREK